jgi:hypothetical protein
MPLATDRSCFLLAAALAAMASPGLRAIDVPLNRADMQRAVSLSRWPHSDAERARFHEPYTVRLDEAPVVDSWSAVQVEVITEFRRVELMGEQNAALGTLWGRAGVGDVEDAIRPWRGRVSIVARIDLRAEGIFVGPFPPVTLLLGESDAPAPLDTPNRGLRVVRRAQRVPDRRRRRGKHLRFGLNRADDARGEGDVEPATTGPRDDRFRVARVALRDFAQRESRSRCTGTTDRACCAG